MYYSYRQVTLFSVLTEKAVLSNLKMITSTHKLIFQLASTDKISCQTVQEIQSKKRIKELLEVLDLH